VTPFDIKICSSLEIVASANPQRFPVYGTITLHEYMAKVLNNMCRTGDAKIALDAIKGSRYNLPSKGLLHYKSNMSRIPNDELDPYYQPSKENG